MNNKKKRKEKRKRRREGGREGGGGGEEPLEKRLGGPRVCLYIPSRVFRRGIKRNAERLSWVVVTGVWTGECSMNWFTDFPPSGPIYNSTLPRVRETPKVDGPNSNLRPLRSSPFTLSSSLGPILSLVRSRRSSMVRAGSTR